MNIDKVLIIRKKRWGKIILLTIFLTIIIPVLYLLIWAFNSGPDVTYRVLVNCCDSDIDDYKRYPGRTLVAVDTPFLFGENIENQILPDKVELKGKDDIHTEGLIESNDTIAFLVIKDDVMVYEKYYQGHSFDSVSMAFSATKSILSVLIGIAVDEGLIKSIDQPVSDYIPELKDSGFENVTLKSLLQMHSGINYIENDDPFGEHVLFNYTANLRKAIYNLKTLKNHSDNFVYRSSDNAVLGLVLDRALKGKTITQYTQEKLWEPLGMEFDGIWTLDSESDGLEKTWCCLSATARDFAKFGRLYLNNGNWNGKQVVSREWVNESLTGAFDSATWPISELTTGFDNYGYQWWLCSGNREDYMARGKNGQFIYVNPSMKTIIVRLGWSEGTLSHEDWENLFVAISENIN